jgi:hypothetical protein
VVSLVPYASNSVVLSTREFQNDSNSEMVLREVDLNFLNPSDVSDVKDYSQESFLRELKENNDSSKNEVKNIFKAALAGIAPDSCSVFMTGSDGRNEKLGEDSPYDLILVFKKNLPQEQKENITKRINDIFKKNKGKFDEEIDFKEFEKDSLLNYKENIIPTRGLDSKQIWGSKDLKHEYYNELFKQIKECKNITYKKFVKKFKQASITQLSKSMQNSTDNQNTHYNIKTGELFYNGKNSRATKMTCLRSIQYYVADHIFKGVQTGAIDKNMLQEVRKERSILNRLTWLSKKGIIKPDSVNQVQNAYIKSLYWYQMAQNAHSSKEKYFANPQELVDVTNTLHKFVMR